MLAQGGWGEMKLHVLVAEVPQGARLLELSPLCVLILRYEMGRPVGGVIEERVSLVDADLTRQVLRAVPDQRGRRRPCGPPA